MVSEAADHVTTMLTEDIGDAASALPGAQELDAYAEAVADLESRQADLATLRSSLVIDGGALISDAASVSEDESSCGRDDELRRRTPQLPAT